MDTIRSQWRSRLKALGFVPQQTRGRRGTYAVRKLSMISQAIGVLIDEDYREGAFNIQLNLNMVLPASEPSHDVVVLLADLSPIEVRIQEPWKHEPGFATWWSPDDMELSWTAFESFGLPWLDSYARVEILTNYFEDEYRRLAEANSTSSELSFAQRILVRMGLGQPQERPVYQQYLLWLAMLYEQQGNTEKALKSLNHYAKWVEVRGMKNELERLSRHKALLTG